MAWPGSRLLVLHRVFLLSPICLLTLVCMWSSVSFRLTPSPHESLEQDAQCFSCSDESRLLHVNLPSSSYIKEFVLRNNPLKVEDSRREYSSLTQPVTYLTSDDDFNSDSEWESGLEVELYDEAFSTNRMQVDAVNGDGSEIEESSIPNVETDRETTFRGGQREVLTRYDSLPFIDGPVTTNGPSIVTTEAFSDSNGDIMQVFSENGTYFNAPKEDVVNLREDNNISTFISLIAKGLSKDELNGVVEVKRLLSELKKLTPDFIEGQSYRSFHSRVAESGSCMGRKIYIYNLPSKFNVDLLKQCDTLLPWFDFCEYFSNEGFGRIVNEEERFRDGEKVLVPRGAWHETHQYALEMVFHARLMHYPCLTNNADEASLFYVPYYGGLDVIRWHFRFNLTADARDRLTMELLSWLEQHASWKRHGGRDHLFVLGKISWDFRSRRKEDNTIWGSNFLNLDEMSSTTKLLIERDPWDPNDIGVPHPTYFHPRSDADMREWITHVSMSERTSLVSFAGMPRPNQTESIRSHLIDQCLQNSADCYLLRCELNICLRPEATMNLFLHSQFCMQPPGDSPTRRSVFDSIIAGCIPVLFDPYTAYFQYPWHLPEDPNSYSVYVPARDVMNGVADIVQILRRISPEVRNQMRQRIINDIIPGLVYSRPGNNVTSFRDAFDISIERLLQRVSHL